MNLTPEEREQIVAELKRFATDLNLTDDQKQVLHNFLTEARTKLSDYRAANPDATRVDVIRQIAAQRDQVRQRLVEVLNPEQLKKWDVEAVSAKEFLGQKIAA